MSVLLVQGTARQIPLRDQSVSCCVTSPPYYSLRDYGTGQWLGGEAGCTHEKDGLVSFATNTLGRSPGSPRLSLPGTNAAFVGKRQQYTGTCPRCGAVRVDQQIGLEDRADCNGAFTGNACGSCWVCAMRAVFAEVWRVLTPTGTLWCNVGDSMSRSGAAPPRRDHSMGQGLGTYGRQGYSAASAMPARPPGPLPEKNLLGLPWRLALALQADGWILRSEIIWEKPSCMPESVTDRCTRSHEQVFLFAKSPRYYFDMEPIRELATMRPQARLTPQPRREGQHAADAWAEPRRLREVPMLDGNPAGRNARTVWRINPEPLTGFQHYAAFPTALVRRCLLAGAPTQVCRTCGKPWVRQVEKRLIPQYASRHGGYAAKGDAAGMVDMSQTWTPGTNHVTTTGFLPTCACNAPTRRSVILDPFAGSGTVGLVARELGHDAVCLDLSMAYLRDIARERLGLAALQRWEHGATTRAESYGDLPLFGG